MGFLIKGNIKDWSDGKNTVNCGVYVKGVTGGETDFYDIIQHIFHLEYRGLSNKVTLCFTPEPPRFIHNIIL